MSDDRSFQDGWGPSSFDPFEWRPGDRDYGEQHQQRREQTEDNRPNLLRRWINRHTILDVVLLLAAAAGGVLTGIVLIRFAAHLLS